jgi:hypothetical protein
LRHWYGTVHDSFKAADGCHVQVDPQFTREPDPVWNENDCRTFWDVSNNDRVSFGPGEKFQYRDSSEVDSVFVWSQVRVCGVNVLKLCS